MSEQSVSLFRREVVASQGRLRGAVTVTNAAVHWPAVIGLVALVGMLFCTLAFGTYARTESVAGQLVTDGPTAKIIPARAGTLAAIGVHDGDVVKAGQKLATITITQASPERRDPGAADIATLDDQRALLEHQESLAKASNSDESARLNGVVTTLERQVNVLKSQIAIQNKIEASAKAEFEPLEDVMRRGFVSKVEYEQRRQAWLAQIAQNAQLDGQLEALLGQVASLRRQIADLPRQLSNKLDDIKSSAAGLTARRIEAENARAYIITAPIGGKVSGLQSNLGSSVSAQTPLMTIVSGQNGLTAELYAPSRSVGFVKVGEEVRLIYDAFPAATFGSVKGYVIGISPTVINPSDIVSGIPIREPVYRIRVKLAAQTIRAFGNEIQLHPGMTLEAILIAERSSFLHWLLQPIYAARARR